MSRWHRMNPEKKLCPECDGRGWYDGATHVPECLGDNCRCAAIVCRICSGMGEVDAGNWPEGELR